MDSVLESRRALAAKYAAKYGLATELVCAVVEQETGGTWDPYTTRNEDDFYARYVEGKEMPPDSIRSRSTEARTRAMSFGLMQLIGETARELGFAERYITKLCDPDTGLYWGCKMLRKCLDEAGGDETKALLRWNGGSNRDYPTQVLARKEKYVVS